MVLKNQLKKVNSWGSTDKITVDVSIPYRTGDQDG